MHENVDMHKIYLAARMLKSNAIASTVLESQKAATRVHIRLKVSHLSVS